MSSDVFGDFSGRSLLCVHLIGSHSNQEQISEIETLTHLFQLLHVDGFVQVQAGVLVFIGVRIDEPLQEPLQAKKPKFIYITDLG